MNCPGSTTNPDLLGLCLVALASPAHIPLNLERESRFAVVTMPTGMATAPATALFLTKVEQKESAAPLARWCALVPHSIRTVRAQHLRLHVQSATWPIIRMPSTFRLAVALFPT